MTAIINYGVGNLFSLKCSLESIGEKVIISSSAEELEAADRLILPGVGAFGDAAEKLRTSGLGTELMNLVKKGIPVLGVCLGMQLLFDKSYEFGCHEGLGLIKGEIVPFKDSINKNLKIPHMGWNSLTILNEGSPLVKELHQGDYVYFVHSFYARCPETSITAYCDYGVRVPAIVQNENIFGCQFHPEKSGTTGLSILKQFCSFL